MIVRTPAGPSFVSILRQLAAAGAEDGAVGAQQVAEVELEQLLQRLLAEHVDAGVQLHPPGAVVEVDEGRLALAAARVDAARDAHAGFRGQLFGGLRGVIAQNIGKCVCEIEALAEGTVAEAFNFMYARSALLK